MNLTPTAHASSSLIYDNPIPGREFILSLFGKMKQHLNRQQIADALNLNNSEQKEALRRRLRAMERDGQLMFNQHQGYQLIDQALLIEGVISLHPDGFGFVNHSATEKDLFLAKNQLTHVFDGDIVQVLLEPGDNKRSYHKLIKVLERKTTHIAGLLKRQGKDLVLIADNSKISQPIQVANCPLAAANVGLYVNSEITQYPSFRQTSQVQITEVLGPPGSAGMETKLALRRHGISEQWSDSIIKQAKSLGNTVTEQDKKSRVDYTALPFVTIDGADAKDFDDAVYCEKSASGDWRLLVAIADVAHYVKPNDALDVAAQQRATSIYCPGQVIPMLPVALSNGLCSLVANTDRLVMICELTISPAGEVKQAVFKEGIIHSHARLTYDQAHAIVTKPNSNMAKKVTALLPTIAQHINNLHALYLSLAQARSARGAIEFDSQERKLNLNKQHKIASIEPVIRNDAHRMIEEFMLCANVATAQFLQQHKIPSLFRVHAGPQQKKLTLLRTLLAEKGLQLGGGDKPTPSHYNKLLTNIDQRADASVIRSLLLRSQSQAEYSATNAGHFGLAYDAYAHFTSPIRRYPDLLTHRAIKAKIQSKAASPFQQMLGYLKLPAFTTKKLPKKLYPYSLDAITALSSHCSTQSRKADEVSREVEAALKCQYMAQFVGKPFAATVTGVCHFGFFVQLISTGVEGIEGLVPLASFSQGEFVFDPAKQQLVNSQQRICLGDSVTVGLKTIDLAQRKMDFVLTSIGQDAAA
ncbi:ribonuclease R [Rheinheimera salexigens]|uniref:Ribonuclease R n=1 Tax=Rheinheimera salexigens TaxID=1628148 RepID=A0A1E7Q4U8_9GAMM|nr:ribonuclease R [Rheinheimera salexigens]OEY69179.1 ribonuclease R [Rheinheimera salexigens]